MCAAKRDTTRFTFYTHVYMRMYEKLMMHKEYSCTYEMRCVHYNLHEQARISGTNMSNLVSMYLGMHRNCNPMITV